MKKRHRNRTGGDGGKSSKQFLQATLSVVLTRLVSFYRCSFSVNLGEIREQRSGLTEATRFHCALVVLCGWVCGTQEHIWMNICEVHSPRIRLWRVGACAMRGLFSMLLLLAQNLLTQRLRATATFNLFFFYNQNHETHPQICVFFLEYTRLKWKDFRLGFRLCFSICFFSFLIFVLAATLLLYLLLYIAPVLQQCGAFHTVQWEAFLLNSSDAKCKRLPIL